MRNGFIRDVHFGFGGEEEKIKMLKFMVNDEGVDIILSGGDFDYIPFDKSGLRELLNGVPLLTVYGNHDIPEALQFYNILMEDAQVYTFEDIVICGLGGAVISDN